MSSAVLAPARFAATRTAQLELFALCAFAFVLPLFEAPKNLLWVLYAGLWIASRWRARDFGGPWKAWDTLIVLWIASGYASAVFAGLHHNEWTSAHDILRYASMLWLLRRSHYPKEAFQRLFGCLILGTLVALAWGYYVLWVTKARPALELHSVGHVNHSAIYLGVAFGAALAWLRAAWCFAGAGVRIAGLLVCAAFGMSLFAMASGSALGVTFAASLLLLGTFAVRSRKPYRKVLVSAVVIAGVALAAMPRVVEKNVVRLQENRLLSPRDDIWRVGLQAWRRFPLFGAGMGNYSRIDYAALEAWSRARGESLDRSRMFLTSHGHSLYVNTLAERGAVGLALVLGVLVAWGWALARSVPEAAEPPLCWAFWGGAFAAWLVAVLVGLVNTTLHHEHALLSMLLLGGWLSLRRGPAQVRDVRP